MSAAAHGLAQRAVLNVSGVITLAGRLVRDRKEAELLISLNQVLATSCSPL